MAWLAEALRDPAAYPFAADSVETRQTHISWVFLAGAFAYKVKKPVNFGFLDYSTLEKRRFYCQEEVRLNRRLAPDVYLGVVPITRDAGKVRMEGAGEIIDYAVKMRRLTPERMLDKLLNVDLVSGADIQRLADRIVAFHTVAEWSPALAEFGSQAVIRANWNENFEQASVYIGRTISQQQFDRCRDFVHAQMHSKQAAFEARVSHARIRDCHGDLRSESVWMAEDGRFEIFDCIEFNERFRYADVASEVAFMATDLDWRGRPDLAWTWVDRYVRTSGDSMLFELLPFYKCYRAFVRGKVESFALDQEGFRVKELEAHEEAARQHFSLAEMYTAQLKPVLIVICGPVGTGKTTVAWSIASLLGITVLSSDSIRKELAGLKPDEHTTSGFNVGLYAPEMTRLAYNELFLRARQALTAGRSVILDATFSQSQDRAHALAVARAAGADCVVLQVTAPRDVARGRVLRRGLDPGNPSDANFDIFDRTYESFEPPSEIEPSRLTTVDTSQPIALVARELVCRIRQRCEITGRPACGSETFAGGQH